MAGANGKIWHYDGNNWSENYQHSINGFIGVSFYDIYGTNYNDLYAVGMVWFNNETRRGIILHYDGKKWEQKYLANFNSYFYKIKESFDKRCFIDCIKYSINSTVDTTVFYEFDGKELTEIYTDKDKYIKQGWVSTISGNPYFSLSNIIYKYDQFHLKELFKSSSQYYTPTIFGRTEKDIFLGTSEGIEHYNGTDTQLLLAAEGWANEGLLFDKEVFFLRSITIYGSSQIYHGKLKE